MKKYKSGKKFEGGFTLIETIIYMGLLSIILLIITNLLITASYFSQEETARLEIQKNGRFVTELIIRDLQNASSVDVPNDNNPTNNLIAGDVSYGLISGTLIRSESGDFDNVTSNQVKVESLEFRKIANVGGRPSIQIKININFIGEVEGKRDISQEFETTYYLK